MAARKPYNRDSLERALIHHGIDYSPPHVGHPKWRITTGIDAFQWSTAEVHSFVVGLAEKERASREQVS